MTQDRHIVRVSRDSLTRCPTCIAFFKVDASLHGGTPCPFCGAALADARHAARPVLASLLSRGRGGLIAASLLGVAALAPACLSPQPGSVGGVIDSGSETSDADASAGDVLQAVGDVTDPDSALHAETEVEVELSPEPPAQSDYGLPADWEDF